MRKVNYCGRVYSVGSVGEEIVLKELLDRGIEFEQEKTFSDLVGDSGFPLRFDFYVRGKRRDFIIEVDGTQHRKKKYYSSDKLKRYDKKKDDYCRLNNIKLYRLIYISSGFARYLHRGMKRIFEEEF